METVLSSEYEILVMGEFRRENVTTRFDPSLRVKYASSQIKEIEEVWNNKENIFGDGVRYINKPLFRLTSQHRRDGKLCLKLGLTSFKEFLGTNLYEEERELKNKEPWSKKYGWKIFSNPVIVTFVAETLDKKMIYEIRSKEVIKCQGMLHVKPSGFALPIDYLDKEEEVDVDIFDVASKHIEEELGIKRKEVADIICTGLVMDSTYHVPVVTFKMKTSLPSDEIIKRPREHEWESEETRFIDYNSEEVYKFMLDNQERIVPTGHGAILLAGRIDFGQDWFTNIICDHSCFK